MGRLDNKVAIVTGSARGLGGGTVDALAEEGAIVIITDILDEAGEARAASLRERGLQAVYHHLDVRDEASWKTLVDAALAKHGHLDVLVNNAGVSGAFTIEDGTLEDMKKIMDINFVGPFLGMKAAIPAMRKSGGGAIVNISSNSTAMVMPITTFYGASKAALANMSKAAAVHCASSGYNIRINTIHPGPHATEMILGGDVPAADLPGMRPLLKAIPMGRLGTPQELGKAVVFLASDDSSFMTAAELFTDGGLTCVSFGAEPVPRA